MTSSPDVLWAVVPVKSFALAKARLSPVLCPGDRQRLALAMADDVLGAIRAARIVERLCVLSDHDSRDAPRTGGRRRLRRAGAEGRPAALASRGLVRSALHDRFGWTSPIQAGVPMRRDRLGCAAAAGLLLSAAPAWGSDRDACFTAASDGQAPPSPWMPAKWPPPAQSW